jgi:dolichol-phosphate mannosyltransferase
LKFLVVIPTYNEAENLQSMISALFSLPIEDLHILIVDDNSPDGTGGLTETIKRDHPAGLDVLHRTGKLGLGTAYITGFKYGLENGYDLIGQMDADFSHPPEKLVELVKAVRDGADLALGSRYIPGGSLDRNWPLWRKFLSGFGNYYSRTILKLSIRDVTGGFRVWNRNMLERMPLDQIKSNGYVFQVEMMYVASKLGCKTVEIPIYFADRKLGSSKMSFWIQVEAAIKVWRLPGIHKDIKSI